VYGSGTNTSGQLGLGTAPSSNNVFVNIFNVSFSMFSLVINQNISNAGTIQLNNQTISTPYSNEFEEYTNITIK